MLGGGIGVGPGAGVSGKAFAVEFVIKVGEGGVGSGIRPRWCGVLWGTMGCGGML